jgi:hypothetical protein
MKVKKSGLRLHIDFSYDHTSGLYYAHLENGAVIPISRNDVSGKLENTLNLFRRGVIAIEHPDESRTPKDRSKDVDLINEAVALGMVQTVGVIKPAEIDLSLLDGDVNLDLIG